MNNGNEKTSFFKTYLTPGFVLMSVMIGGGFATGREIVQFGGIYGAKGWIVGLSIAIGFSILAMISFEIARLYKAYDYRTHLSIYSGFLSIIFDITFFVLSLLVMSVMASATGNVLQDTLGIPYYGGVLIILVLTALVVFFGQSVIEKIEVFGAIALYVGYIIFAILAISGRTDNIVRVFAEVDTSYVGTNINVLSLIWTGLLYVGYNVQPLTTTFFVLERQKTRKEALGSGLLSGFIIMIPWVLTYVALMAYYPSEEVFSSTIPWLAMMKKVSPIVVVFFSIVVGWTLVATAVGVINAVTGRLDKQLSEHNKPVLTSRQKTYLTIAYLGGAVILARFGIIDLIAKGYTIMSISMIISFVLPLITVGLYKIIKYDKTFAESNKN